MEIILNEYGSKIRVKDKMISVQSKEKNKEFSPFKVKKIYVASHSSISGEVVELCQKHNIDLIFFDSYNNPCARIWNNKFGSISTIRKNQLEYFKTIDSFNLIKRWQLDKIDKYIEMSFDDVYLVNELSKLKKKMNNVEINTDLVDFRKNILSIEAHASKLFFKYYNSKIPVAYKVKRREKKNSITILNSMLNYGFGILYNLLENEIIISGLDPSYGIMHIDNYGKIPFVYDLIERYRYLIYILILNILTQNKYEDSDFEIYEKGIKLGPKVRKDISIYFREIFDKEKNNIKKYIKSLSMKIFKIKVGEENGSFNSI